MEELRLQHPLRVKFEESIGEVTCYIKGLRIPGGGTSREQALAVALDHLLMDYYEYDLNPGPALTQEDRAYARKLHGLFWPSWVRDRDRE